MLDVLGVEEGEAHKLSLVEVHHEEFVSGGEVGLLTCELFVKVADILAMFLEVIHQIIDI